MVSTLVQYKYRYFRRIYYYSFISTPYNFYVFFSEHKAFLFRSGGFSRAVGCRARRGPVCTPRCNCGSRPGPVSRALGVQRSQNLASNHRIAFRPATVRVNQARASPHAVILFIFQLSAAVFEVPQQPSKARQPQQPRFKLFPL